MPDRRELLRETRLYLVLEAEPAERVVPAAVAGGDGMVQLRERGLGDDELIAAARRVQSLCADALFLVNDRPDVALACGADGVHVGQDDQPVDEVRSLVGPDLLIGLSTHSPEQLAAGLATDADYLSVGPVWETPTKEGRPATGLGYVRHAAEVAGERPWFAIGGIDSDRIGAVVEAGARRAVVVRALRDAGDPRAAAAGLMAEMEAVHVL